MHQSSAHHHSEWHNIHHMYICRQLMMMPMIEYYEWCAALICPSLIHFYLVKSFLILTRVSDVPIDRLALARTSCASPCWLWRHVHSVLNFVISRFVELKRIRRWGQTWHDNDKRTTKAMIIDDAYHCDHQWIGLWVCHITWGMDDSSLRAG